MKRDYAIVTDVLAAINQSQLVLKFWIIWLVMKLSNQLLLMLPLPQ